MVFLIISLSHVLGQVEQFGLENQKVTSLALSQTYSFNEFIIAGTESNGIFMKGFTGEDTSWFNHYFYNRYVTSVFVQRQGRGPQDYSRIFVGLQPNSIDSTLIYSYDSPILSFWSKRDSGLTTREINGISSFAAFNYSGHQLWLPIFCCADNAHIYSLSNTAWDTSWSGIEGLSAIRQLYANDSTIFACGTFNGFIPAPIVLISEDYGNTWDEYSPTSFVNNFAYSITASNDSDTIYVGLNNKIIKSIDRGKNWNATSLQIENAFFNSLVINPLIPSQVFAGGKTNSNMFLLYKSDNGGITWERIDMEWNCNNCVIMGVNCMTGRVNNNEFELYIGTDGSGVYKYISKITGITSKQSISPEFKLFQNYPNPFNPTTAIEYSIKYYSFVSLKIYNILGKEIATLVNEYKNPGNYKNLFNGKNLSSGVYYTVLKADKYMQVRKMLLIK